MKCRAVPATANWGGFALVELAMIILMLAALGLMSLPMVLRSGHRALQAGCASRLNQVGIALQMYAQSHSELLPGPLFPVALAGYDETAQQELAWYIAESLGFPKPSKRLAVLPALVCPKYDRQGMAEASLAGCRSYVLNENLARHSPVRVPPFGSPAAPVIGPLKLSALPVYGDPASIFALADADKANVNPRLPCWEELPCRPAHDKGRTRLFFDGHVETGSR